MSDIRRSLLSNSPVLIATERSMRPDDFSKRRNPKRRPDHRPCPFCPGNEAETAQPEIMRLPDAGSPWTLRVVPNKFPAATLGERSRFMLEAAESSVITNAHGAHEVIIDTDLHNTDLARLQPSRIEQWLSACSHRMEALYSDRRIRFVQVFKNHGADAGASVEHPHSQIIALPHIPEKLNERLHRCRQHKLQRGKDAFEEAIDVADRYSLVVQATDHFFCYTPYDSKVPFELTIMPLQSIPRFAESEQHYPELSTLMNDVFKRLHIVLTDLPAFNLFLEEAPPNVYYAPEDFFRWRWRVLPRLTRMAGFEFSTGYFINPLPPEHTAEWLRRAAIRSMKVADTRG